MKFIRVNGRVVPIKGDGSAPKGSGISKRYGAKPEKAKPSKSIGVGTGAANGAILAAGAFSATELYRIGKQAKSIVDARKSGIATIGKITKPASIGKLAKVAAIGAIVGAAIGSVKIYKKKRGESNAQMAKRAGKYK